LDEADAPTAEAEAAAVTPSVEPTGSEPHFTPMTLRPILTNGAVVAEVLSASYPALLRDAGIGGAPVVWIHIATSGEVDDARVFESAGHEALDRAALDVARTMIFQPAKNGDAVTDAWVQIPIRFHVGD
jgi:TonB family protein